MVTTEILRDMLYRGAPILLDVEWVIFDEIHYITDPERGVIWEESIIMLPQHCGVVCLSATAPNAMECAAWIGRTKQKRVYVISTSHRPTPLLHFLYAGEQLWRVVDDKGTFLDDAFEEASIAKKKWEATQKKEAANVGGKLARHWATMLHTLRQKQARKYGHKSTPTDLL